MVNSCPITATQRVSETVCSMTRPGVPSPTPVKLGDAARQRHGCPGPAQRYPV